MFHIQDIRCKQTMGSKMKNVTSLCLFTSGISNMKCHNENSAGYNFCEKSVAKAVNMSLHRILSIWHINITHHWSMLTSFFVFSSLHTPSAFNANILLREFPCRCNIA